MLLVYSNPLWPWTVVKKFAYAENELHFFLYYFFIDCVCVCVLGESEKENKPLGKSIEISWEGALYSNRILSLYSYVDHKNVIYL